MKKNKVIGALLLILAVSTITGMIIDKIAFWTAYNWATIIFSAISGFALLKEA
ncbi:MAG: hypothetical protein KKH08_03805 [Candidatus Omnitrophica bacterium]|nr:hypothetical protein [Candidatus Omnitrophota bacterium]